MHLDKINKTMVRITSNNPGLMMMSLVSSVLSSSEESERVFIHGRSNVLLPILVVLKGTRIYRQCRMQWQGFVQVWSV